MQTINLEFNLNCYFDVLLILSYFIHEWLLCNILHLWFTASMCPIHTSEFFVMSISAIPFFLAAVYQWAPITNDLQLLAYYHLLIAFNFLRIAICQ